MYCTLLLAKLACSNEWLNLREQYFAAFWKSLSNDNKTTAKISEIELSSSNRHMKTATHQMRKNI